MWRHIFLRLQKRNEFHTDTIFVTFCILVHGLQEPIRKASNSLLSNIALERIISSRWATLMVTFFEADGKIANNCVSFSTKFAQPTCAGEELVGILSWLNRSCHFSSIGSNASVLQMTSQADCRELIGVNTHLGLHACNIFAIWTEGFICQILVMHLSVSLDSYQGDVVFHAPNISIRSWRRVSDFTLTINSSKCVLNSNFIVCPGYRTDKDCSKPNPEVLTCTQPHRL